jgi:hypothetical protein
MNNQRIATLSSSANGTRLREARCVQLGNLDQEPRRQGCVALLRSADPAEMRLLMFESPIERVGPLLGDDRLGQCPPAPVNDVAIALEPELGEAASGSLPFISIRSRRSRRGSWVVPGE